MLKPMLSNCAAERAREEQSSCGCANPPQVKPSPTDSESLHGKIENNNKVIILFIFELIILFYFLLISI
jgi:hypothetical protein